LEAITTKKCQEKFHLESLEALGDSFLKYAASQQLFRTYQNNHEGLLSVKKDRIVSNAALCRVGCDHKLPVTILYLYSVFDFLSSCILLKAAFKLL
jgi:endoribonuclease Dicer